MAILITESLEDLNRRLALANNRFHALHDRFRNMPNDTSTRRMVEHDCVTQSLIIQNLEEIIDSRGAL